MTKKRLKFHWFNLQFPNLKTESVLFSLGSDPQTTKQGDGRPCEEASALSLQRDDLLAKVQKAFPDKEHPCVTLQGESSQLTGALPFTLQQLVGVLLQKQLSVMDRKAVDNRK